MSIQVRRARQDDLGEIYRISLQTGAAGQDATARHRRPELIGDIWSAPYVVLEPDLALVATLDGRICGFAVGTPDSDTFEDRLEALWWPDCRRKYPLSDMQRVRPADAALMQQIHEPTQIPQLIKAQFPAHMHLNTDSTNRGKGVGRRLYETWTGVAANVGIRNLHIGAHSDNAAGIAFWRAMGFEPIELADPELDQGIWMGQKLA